MAYQFSKTVKCQFGHFLIINELSFRNRKCRENTLLSGLWFGPSKPVMNYFCGPLHSSLLELEHGIDLNTDDGNFFVQGFLSGA